MPPPTETCQNAREVPPYDHFSTAGPVLAPQFRRPSMFHTAGASMWTEKAQRRLSSLDLRRSTPGLVRFSRSRTSLSSTRPIRNPGLQVSRNSFAKSDLFGGPRLSTFDGPLPALCVFRARAPLSARRGRLGIQACRSPEIAAAPPL